MFQDQYPHFEKDSVLKASMLANLREYPRDMFSLLYREYSDGIITGVQVVVENQDEMEGGCLLVKPGIIKYHGCLYYMKEDVRIPYRATERMVLLKVKFFEEQNTDDFTMQYSRIILDEDTQLQVDELELCRFVIKEGAELRQDYQDVQDFSTMHNTINRIHVAYAGIGESTITPELTTYYGEELIKHHSENPYDISFAMNCLYQNPIPRCVIMQYLYARRNIRMTDRLTNQEIHSYFVSIMEEVKSGKTSRNSGERMGRRVIVE